MRAKVKATAASRVVRWLGPRVSRQRSRVSSPSDADLFRVDRAWVRAKVRAAAAAASMVTRMVRAEGAFRAAECFLPEGAGILRITKVSQLDGQRSRQAETVGVVGADHPPPALE